ncbi:MAG: PASTA domain-containing protein [Acidobacteriota bacterium]
MWRKLVRGLGCLGYLGILGVVFGLVAYVSFSLFVRGGVTMTPEVIGMAEAEAVALLADQGLDTVWADDERYDEKVAKGRVMQQDPQSGVYVKRNTQVVLTLSRGPRRIEVPDVAGQAVQAAQVSLAAAGLTLGRTFDVYSEGTRGGAVVSQHPAAGERVEQDAPIDLFVARDDLAQVYLMPDLIRRNYDSVRAFFESRGFRFGRVSYQPYEGASPGTVLQQYPEPGHPLRRGDAIALTLVAPERGAADGLVAGAETDPATRTPQPSGGGRPNPVESNR